MSDYISRGEAYKAIMGEHPDAHYPDWYASLIEAIPAADVRPVRWIPVEERMPETDKMVLVVRSDGDMAVAGWNAALGWLHYWSGFRVRNVTHWMPLPELPSVNGKETEHDPEREG
jgi:hypothetical protein